MLHIKIVAALLLVTALLTGLAACGAKDTIAEQTDSSTGSSAETWTAYNYETDDTQAVQAFNQMEPTEEMPTIKQSESVKQTAEETKPSAAQNPSVPQSTTSPTAKTQSETVKVTVKEGQTLTEIFTSLANAGVSSFDALMSTAQSYDYGYYPLVAKIPSNQNRCFKLEGYLFPDTYEFYLGEKPQDAIGRFLRNGKVKITDEMMSKASSLGYTMDEVLTVASIIQKEGSKPSEVSTVAAVIYNRLRAGQKLQMDSTIHYIERNVKPFLSGDINRYNSFYNTYKCAALPTGPISNPGLTTINAALNPADVSYLYFCHDANANYYYADTFEEHQENLKAAGIA